MRSIPKHILLELYSIADRIPLGPYNRFLVYLSYKHIKIKEYRAGL